MSQEQKRQSGTKEQHCGGFGNGRLGLHEGLVEPEQRGRSVVAEQIDHDDTHTVVGGQSPDVIEMEAEPVRPDVEPAIEEKV